jgi:phosphoribosylglycinamide formyltransferase 2
MSCVSNPAFGFSHKDHAAGQRELGKEVIIALQRIGVEVTAVDRYPNAPGMQVAHKSRVIDMSDASQLRALVEEVKPHIIVPEIEAIATEELERIEAEGLAELSPQPGGKAHHEPRRHTPPGRRGAGPSHIAIHVSPQQGGTVRTLRKNRVPLFHKTVSPPPARVSRAFSGEAEIDAAWDYAASAGRVNLSRVIVEGMIRFDYEITQLTVRALGPSGNVETFFCEPVGHVQVKGDYVESWQPMAMSKTAIEKARHIAAKITGALETGIFAWNSLHQRDDVYFSE